MEQATLLQEEKPFLKQNQILQVQLTESQEEIQTLKGGGFQITEHHQTAEEREVCFS